MWGDMKSSPIAAHAGISGARLDVTICLLLRSVFLRRLMAGLFVVEVKMSLKVARERLTVFGADAGFALRGGVGAPSGGIGERDTSPLLGVSSPGDLICLGCFRVSELRLTLSHCGCEEPLSASSDDPPTLHQFPGGRLLRFSGSSGPDRSLDFFGAAAVGRLACILRVPWNTWLPVKQDIVSHVRRVKHRQKEKALESTSVL